MRFPAPDGTTLLSPLASGAVFMAALVRDGNALLVCKRLLPRVRAEPAARAAMAREGLALAQARHPSLPALRRVGADAHGPFVLETRVEGTSLRALAEGWAARGRPVPPTLVTHVAAAASAALAAVHALEDDRGPLLLSHGDLTPDHVLLGPLGDVGFVDLGAARFADMDPALDTGDRGTLPFVPPEVARGEVTPDQATDVYALAATLLYLATGGPIAAARDGAALLLEVCEHGLSPALGARAAGLSGAVRRALVQAIRKDPRERLARAADLAAALAPVDSG